MKKSLFVIVTLGWLLGCDASKDLNVEQWSASQRTVLAKVFETSLRGFLANGILLESNVHRDDSANFKDLLKDVVYVEYSGLASLSESPEIVVPSLTLTIEVSPETELFAGASVIQQKYLLTHVDVSSDTAKVLNLSFDRVGHGRGESGQRITLSADKNDWIESRLVVNEEFSTQSFDIFIDEQSASKISLLFAELNKRLDELK